MTKPNDIQHGGEHYKGLGDLEPWDVIHAWNLGFLEGTMLKRLQRWRKKGKLDDLRKIQHELDKYVEQHPNHNGRIPYILRIVRTMLNLSIPAHHMVARAWRLNETERRALHCLSPWRICDWVAMLHTLIRHLITEELKNATSD